ncbi:MAG TPA: carbon-nitrogen family hydrolase [Verrucomicrobiae bacterium]
MVTIIGLQFDIAWENKAANYATVRRLLAHAGPEPDSLVILPEMFATGFSMNASLIAEDYGGPTEQFLAGIAREFRVTIIAGAAMRAHDRRVRNKAVVFGPDGKLIAFYSKMRPFTPGGEAEHYTAGEKVVVFSWAGINVSPFICYDLRFPELFREAAARHRPELFVVIANFPAKRLEHWEVLLQARAVENQAFVVGVNRTGTDPFCEYPGRSMIVGPTGEILTAAGDGEEIFKQRLDLEGLWKYREGLPFLNDLRASYTAVASGGHTQHHRKIDLA